MVPSQKKLKYKGVEGAIFLASTIPFHLKKRMFANTSEGVIQFNKVNSFD